MTTHNGRSGSPNPGEGANPFKLASTTEASVVITRLKRIAESQPTAWEGVTSDGHRAHIAYRFGVVSVDLIKPLPDNPRFAVRTKVARFKPLIIEAELEGKTHHDRYARRLMAERAMTMEIRRSNEADMRDRANGRNANGEMETLLNRGRLVIRDRQLLRWMETRNRHLHFLLQQGVAGGRVPVVLHLDEKSR